MKKILLKRTIHGLHPDNELATDKLRTIAIGDVVQCQITKPRSLPWHRRYFALVGIIADNTTYTAEEVHILLKLRCGCCKLIKERNGKEFWVPDSIAFDRMDGTDWAVYWKRVEDYVCQELIPGIDKEGLRNEIADLVGLWNGDENGK